MEQLRAEIPLKPKMKTRPVSEARKIRKPLMERKRRERINTSLNELARLLMEAKKVDSDAGKAAKLEKADILELTVCHLQSIHSGEDNKAGESMSPEAEEKYSQGFSECIKVVERILRRSTTDALREKLLNHLNSKLKIMKSSQKISRNKENLQSLPEEQTRLTENTDLKMQCDEEISMNNITLVPTELPGGEVAFIIKGDTKKLLREWKGKEFFKSSEKENRIPELKTSSNNSVGQHQKELSYNGRSLSEENIFSLVSGFQSETNILNPSCDPKNNFDISIPRPSSASQNSTSNSTQIFPCPSLPKAKLYTVDNKDYCYLYPSVSPVPTENLNNFSPEAQTQCLSDTYYSESEAYVVSTYSAPTHHAYEHSTHLIPSNSHASINLSDRNQNSSNQVSNLNGNCSPSSSGSSQQRLPHKAHCPPTPPPSPPSGAEHRKSPKDCLNEPENRLVHEAEIDIDQPFDLSMNKMWRPW